MYIDILNWINIIFFTSLCNIYGAYLKNEIETAPTNKSNDNINNIKNINRKDHVRDLGKKMSKGGDTLPFSQFSVHPASSMSVHHGMTH